jgi:hypothetical protein
MLRDTGIHKKWFRNYTILAALSIAVLLITAGAGLFGSGIYEDFSPPKYVQESRAQDLITLVLGVPLLILAVIGVRRERSWAFPLWTGVLAYELYVYAIYAVGGVYNIFFPGYIAAASLSLYTIIGLLSSVDKEWFQASVREKMPRRWIGSLFLLITTIFAAIWMGQVVNTISTGVIDSGHLIFVFDQMIVLPAFAITAVKLFQNKPFGDLLAGMLLIKFDSLCVAITLGQLFRSKNGIEVESELLGVFIPLGLIGLVFTILYFKNLKQ